MPGKFPATDSLAERTSRGRADHRLYYVTTRDFKRYSKAKLLYDGGFSAIDGTIAHVGARYYLVLKGGAAQGGRFDRGRGDVPARGSPLLPGDEGRAFLPAAPVFAGGLEPAR